MENLQSYSTAWEGARKQDRRSCQLKRPLVEKAKATHPHSWECLIWRISWRSKMSHGYRIKLVGHRSITVHSPKSPVSSSIIGQQGLGSLGTVQILGNSIEIISECTKVVIVDHGCKFFDTSIDRWGSTSPIPSLNLAKLVTALTNRVRKSGTLWLLRLDQKRWCKLLEHCFLERWATMWNIRLFWDTRLWGSPGHPEGPRICAPVIGFSLQIIPDQLPDKGVKKPLPDSGA